MAALTRTICLIGPESTGKTELAQALARHFGVGWVPEYAREYALERENKLTIADCEPIARGQIELTDNRQPTTDNRLILDTDLISTVVYSRHYYGDCPAWIVQEARGRRADLYLLMDTDAPWQPDAARDSGGDEREDLFDAFRGALDEFECRWAMISGDWEERLRRAIAEITDNRQPTTDNE